MSTICYTIPRNEDAKKGDRPFMKNSLNQLKNLEKGAPYRLTNKTATGRKGNPKPRNPESATAP